MQFCEMFYQPCNEFMSGFKAGFTKKKIRVKDYILRNTGFKWVN